jgi:transposase
VELIASIPGVGNTTAAKVMTYLGDVWRFKNAKALAAFIGVMPRRKCSGSSRHGRSCISRSGHALMRHSLYMPALVTLKHNP